MLRPRIFHNRPCILEASPVSEPKDAFNTRGSLRGVDREGSHKTSCGWFGHRPKSLAYRKVRVNIEYYISTCLGSLGLQISAGVTKRVINRTPSFPYCGGVATEIGDFVDCSDSTTNRTRRSLRTAIAFDPADPRDQPTTDKSTASFR